MLRKFLLFATIIFAVMVATYAAQSSPAVDSENLRQEPFYICRGGSSCTNSTTCSIYILFRTCRNSQCCTR